MLASDGQWVFDRRRSDSLGPSVGVASVVTLLMFAAAFAAMRSIRVFRSTIGEPRTAPIAVRFESVPVPPPVARAQRVPRLVAPAQAPTAVPSTIPPAAAAPQTVSGDSPPTPRDSSRTPTAAVVTPGIVAPPRVGGITPMSIGGGAPVAPSAVGIGSRTANTGEYRDSVISQRMQQIPALMLTHPPTGRELAELQTSQAEAAKLRRRTTTAGSQDVHVAQGEGLGGAGAVGGGLVTISAPLFSKGPTAAQRRKNDSLNTEYWLRLRRLNDRLLLARDSARRDSLRRDSIAKRRVVPNP